MQNIIEDILFQESLQKNPKLQILKTHFPECFDKEGKLLIDKLEKSLMGGGGVEFSKESYSLNWLGKSYASVLRNEPPTTWIKPNHSFNSTHPNSQNFLIKGDNLEALKLLKNAYEKKIKMIYIDPPYNTGGDGFVYQDDRHFTPRELSTLCGMSEEDCKKMLEYYSKGKNSHSAWLTFMYPRLSLAKNLLRDDGVIFISIDDNEQAQLKLLCDEIFGEENFISCFIWQKKSGGGQAKYFYEGHEYILIYAKNKENFKGLLRKNDKNGIESDFVRKIHGKYTNNDRLKEIYAKYPNQVIEHRNLMFEELEIFQSEKLISSERVREIKDKVEKGEYFLKPFDDDFHLICREVNGGESKMYSIISGVWTSDGNSEIENLFGSLVFENAKPTKLLKFFFEANLKPNDIILDFFAGSGTTAQAVMELNAEDNGNRHFILVQLPESIIEKKSKTAYDFVKNTLGIDEPKISDITQERIIRASKQIKEKHPEYKGDLGFQVFELEKISDELREIRESDFEKVNHLLRDEEIGDLLDTQAILQTFCLYDGVPLGEKIEEVDLGGYRAYRYGNRLYLLHQGFETKHLQELLRRNDEDRDFCVNQIVLLAYCFESARFREIAEAIKYTSKKSSELALVVRG